MAKSHYIYKITDPQTGQFYFGSRTCEGSPYNDDDYMGSMVTWKPKNRDRLIKEIIKDDFKSREEAIQFESRIIEENIDNELNENYNIPSKGFCNYGRVFSEEHIRNLRESHLGNKLSINTKRKISKAMQGVKFSNERKTKISKAISGITRTEKTKRKISNSLKKVFSNKENHPFYGKSLSNEHKINLRHSKKDKCKPVYQLNLDDNIINEYISTSLASNTTGISKVNIRRVCNNERKTAGGYKWRYVNE